MGKIWLGGTELKRVWCGSSEIVKIWQGSTLLWEKSGGGTGGGGTGGGTTTQNAIDYISATDSNNGINYKLITNSHSSKAITVNISFNVNGVSTTQTANLVVPANSSSQWGSKSAMSNFNITSAEFA